MNLKEIRELISMMNDNDLSEVELEREGSKIKLKKQSSETYETIRREPVTYQHPQIIPQTKNEEPEAKESNVNTKGVKSPMVGTFYRAPSPESPPFVEIGQTVEVGQVVCIVEAMKLMNEIKSEVRGKIVEIPVDNAQPVEFGQILFSIEPV